MGDVEAEREDATRSDRTSSSDLARSGDSWRFAAGSIAVGLAVLGVGVGEARAWHAHLASALRRDADTTRTEPTPSPAPTPPPPSTALPPWGGGLSGAGVSAGGAGDPWALGGDPFMAGAARPWGDPGAGPGPGAVVGVPHVRMAALPVVQGGLPPEIVARIVRMNGGRARVCYEPVLRATPLLKGRIAVKFVIDRSGAVSTAAEGPGSTLPNQGVIGCVVRSFLALSFPQPDRGIATVVYRLDLSPSD
jgi:hypothetical protein